jgi:hypothetical protein
MSAYSSISERASSRLSETSPSEIFLSAERSAPEQKSAPAPVSSTARTSSRASASRSDSLSPPTSSSFSAFRFSGRFSVTRANAPSTAYRTGLFSIRLK